MAIEGTSRRDALRAGVALGASAVLGPGCAPDFQVLTSWATPGHRSSVLVVFLTGYSDEFRDVDNHGVTDVLSEYAGPVDLYVVQDQTPQFFSGEFVDAFDRRIVQRPWFRHYQHRVLVGFSSGGTAALAYVAGHPDAFDHLVLYAPYLGPQFIVDEIGEAGGLAKWEPTGPIEDQETRWVWLRRYGDGEVTRPSLWLLWSRDDEVSVGLPALEAHLPRERIITIDEGEHGWLAFDQLWTGFVRDHPDVFTASGQ